jgi:hypothetical protein
VKLDPETRLPLAHRPGVLSFELRRPPQGQQFFAGPFDDVAPGEDTYSPLQRESAYCAPCHSAVVSDNRIPAPGSDKTRYVFEGSRGEAVSISARLLFRRAFITLADQKRWDVDDLLMEEAALHIPWP